MRLERIIPTSDLDEKMSMCWVKHFVNYLKPLSGHVVQLVLDIYEKSEDVSISKRRYQKGKEENITSLNKTLPKSSNWENVLNNDINCHIKNNCHICFVSTNFYRTQSKMLCL